MRIFLIFPLLPILIACGTNRIKFVKASHEDVSLNTLAENGVNVVSDSHEQIQEYNSAIPQSATDELEIKAEISSSTTNNSTEQNRSNLTVSGSPFKLGFEKKIISKINQSSSALNEKRTKISLNHSMNQTVREILGFLLILAGIAIPLAILFLSIGAYGVEGTIIGAVIVGLILIIAGIIIISRGEKKLGS